MRSYFCAPVTIRALIYIKFPVILADSALLCIYIMYNYPSIKQIVHIRLLRWANVYVHLAQYIYFP